jgi:glycine dehydrogenase subunit 1
LKKPLDVEGPLSELEALRRFKSYAENNKCCGPQPVSFLGAGLYHHFIPVIVDHLISRSEFYSAYTPYQPEISQGTLQAVFEYQTYIAMLTGMEVANASLYDGSTAMAEGVLMARRMKKGGRVLVSEAVHPEYREVLDTYCQYLDTDIRLLPHDGSGRTDASKLAAELDDETCCLVVQSPNFFGCIEDLETLKQAIGRRDALLLVVVNEMVSLGFLEPPGKFGADIVVGEAQSLGLPVNYGGPLLGFLATRDACKRNIPGRLAGQTVDERGQKAYVLTISTREQHIKREKATSNICTNQALCALAASIHLSVLGRDGFAEIAAQNYYKAAYAREKIAALKGFRIPFQSPVFNEFVVETPLDPDEISGHLRSRGILSGLNLGRYYPGMKQHILFCVTEVITREEIDHLVGTLEEML